MTNDNIIYNKNINTMNNSLTQADANAVAQAKQDFMNSHSTEVVTDEMIQALNEESSLTPLSALPNCWDFDRFAKHLRNV